jgi:hypothetical protein
MLIKNYKHEDIYIDERSNSFYIEKTIETLVNPNKVICEINDFNKDNKIEYYLSKPDELMQDLIFCVKVSLEKSVIKAGLINISEYHNYFELYPKKRI